MVIGIIQYPHRPSDRCGGVDIARRSSPAAVCLMKMDIGLIYAARKTYLLFHYE